MKFILLPIALAATTAVAGMPVDELEKTYWDCEFKAMQGTILPSEILPCSILYEYLKEEKFFGDINELLSWWRQNKDREMSLRLKPKQP